MDIFDFINEDNHWLPENLLEPTEKIEITLPAQQEIFSAITTSPHIEDTTPCATFSPLAQDGHIFSQPFIPKNITKGPTYSPEINFYGQYPEE